MDKKTPPNLVKTWIDLARNEEIDQEVRNRALSMLTNVFKTPENVALYMKEHGIK
jgi:hypothetical protein